MRARASVSFSIVIILVIVCELAGIKAQAVKSITVSNPAAGSTCLIGGSCLIKWSYTGDLKSIYITLLFGDGYSVLLKRDTYPISLNYFDWIPTNDILASHPGPYRVCLINKETASVVQGCTGVFYIDPPTSTPGLSPTRRNTKLPTGTPSRAPRITNTRVPVSTQTRSRRPTLTLTRRSTIAPTRRPSVTPSRRPSVTRGPTPPRCAGRVQTVAVPQTGVTITSGFHEPFGIQCTWNLQALGRNRLMVNITRAEICDTDVLEITEGYNYARLYRLLAPVPPEGLPISLQTGPKAIISFSTWMMASTSCAGFTVTASLVPLRDYGTTICSGAKSVSIPRGVGVNISSNTGPTYGEGMNCTWYLRGLPGDRLTISFPKFDVQSEYGAITDSVSVYDGPSMTDDGRATFTGGQVDPIVTSGNLAILTFKTDYFVQKSGFVANIVSAPIPTQTPTRTQDRRITPTPVYTATSCKGQQTVNPTVSGTTFFSNLGRFYATNLSCSWLISPPPLNYNLLVCFKWIATQRDHDYLKLYNGINESAVMYITVSGTSYARGWNGCYLMTSRSAFVTFTSDNDPVFEDPYQDGQTSFGFLATAKLTAITSSSAQAPDGPSKLSSESPSSSSTNAVPIAMGVGSVGFVLCALALSAMVIIRKRQATVRTNQVVHVRPRGT